MPNTAVATNRFAAAARQLKARRMADVLTLHHADAASAAALPQSHRLITAELAGCHKPSATTWLLVCQMVAGDARAMVA